MSFLGDPLEVQFIGDGVRWRLARPLRWVDPKVGWVIEVPDGFVTDFASVPRRFWQWLPPAGRYAPAAVLHDWLYASGRVSATRITRPYADDVLRRASGDLGVGRWTQVALYAGVRIGGGPLWDAYRQKELAPDETSR